MSTVKKKLQINIMIIKQCHWLANMISSPGNERTVETSAMWTH